MSSGPSWYFKTIFNCDKHIYANLLVYFNSHLKRTSGRSKHRNFLSLVFMNKSTSKMVISLDVKIDI